MVKFFKSKGIGFYLTLCLVVLSVITAVAYVSSYVKYPNHMSWLAVGLLVGGAVVALVLSVIRRCGWLAPWVQVGTIFSSLMLFIQHLYSYVVVVIVGIDLNSFTPQFILCSVLYAVCVVLSIVNVYLKQEKEAK